MANVYSTPGVYIEEKSAFPNSAVRKKVFNTIVQVEPLYLPLSAIHKRQSRTKETLKTNPSEFLLLESTTCILERDLQQNTILRMQTLKLNCTI